MHKITINKGDACITDIIINVRQPEGWYEYIPVAGDKIDVVFRNKNNTVVRTISKTITTTEIERVSVIMPTDLAVGEYTYDVIISFMNEDGADETHHASDNNIFIIKEED